MSVSECIGAVLVYINPSVKPSVCQLPGRGALTPSENSLTANRLRELN